jgi:hypothetical protein
MAVITLIVGIMWGVVAWFVFALKIEQKLPNHLREVVGELELVGSVGAVRK